MDRYSHRIAEALRVTFDRDGDFTADAPEVRGSLERGESKMALKKILGDIQRRHMAMVSDQDCTYLADELLKSQRSRDIG